MVAGWVARCGSVYILSRRESCGYLDSTSRENFYTIIYNNIIWMASSYLNENERKINKLIPYLE